MQLRCAVCKAELPPTDEVYTTACGHFFHGNCIKQRLQRNATCFMCNRGISFDNIEKLNVKAVENDVFERRADIEKLGFRGNELVYLHIAGPRDAMSSAATERERERESLESMLAYMRQDVDDKENQKEKLKENFDFFNLENTALFANMAINDEIVKNNEIIEDLRRQLEAKSAELQKELNNCTMLMDEKKKLEEAMKDMKASVAPLTESKDVQCREVPAPENGVEGKAAAGSNVNASGRNLGARPKSKLPQPCHIQPQKRN